MGQNKWVKRDRSKETGPKGQIQIDGSKKTGPRRHNGPNISKLVQYGLKSNKKVSKWVRHNQVSWSSFIYVYQPRNRSANAKSLKVLASKSLIWMKKCFQISAYIFGVLVIIKHHRVSSSNSLIVWKYIHQLNSLSLLFFVRCCFSDYSLVK